MAATLGDSVAVRLGCDGIPLVAAMSEYTPGPWEYNAPRFPEASGSVFSIDTNGDLQARDYWTVAEVFHRSPNSEANARLIAAAPDLLAALEKIANDPIGQPGASYREILALIVQIARAALAITKAKGTP